MSYVKTEWQTGDLITADKINKIEDGIEVLSEGYDELKSDLVDHLKESHKAIEDLNDKKIAKFYTNSLGEKTLNDSDNGHIVDMKLYGKSYQKSYSGKNLLNPTLQTTTQNGITCTNNGDGTYTLKGTATADSVFWLFNKVDYVDMSEFNNLKLVGSPNGSSANTYALGFSGSGASNIYDYGNGATLSLVDGALYRPQILVKSGQTVNNVIIKPMITTDLSATYDDFEPYVGGIPSPNPDYPQEIQSVVNPSVKMIGKNLFDGELESGGYWEGSKQVDDKNVRCVSLIEIVPNKKFRISCKDKVNRSVNVNFFNADKQIIQNVQISGTLGIYNRGWYDFCYEAPSNAKYIAFSIESTDTNLEIQLELGEVVTDYEPHKEQSATLPYTLNAIPVSSGGNVTIDGQQYIADYVDIENKKLVRMIKQTTFRGTCQPPITSGGLGWINTTFSDIDLNHSVALCKQYRFASGHGCGETTPCIAFTADDFRIYDTNGKYISADIFYPIATPTIIDLTDEEVQAFKSLHTYYPTTNIINSSDQLDGFTIFNYPVSLKNGWEYVKQQIGDTREYIYDMELQSAEAYVNSEYAVTLTELGV